jgi:hypothetical protein
VLDDYTRIEQLKGAMHDRGYDLIAIEDETDDKGFYRAAALREGQRIGNSPAGGGRSQREAVEILWVELGLGELPPG